MRKGVLIDRDGVLIENRPEYVKKIEEISLIPHVERAICKLWESGYVVCIITNQSGISKGLYSLKTLDEIHRYLQNFFFQHGSGKIRWYFCPHQDSDHCSCRKPKPGMLLQAMADWNLIPEATWMVGDQKTDVSAARLAGCKSALVQTGLGKAQRFEEGPHPDRIFSDLLEFVKFLEGANPP